jgi:hypothetical protein
MSIEESNRLSIVARNLNLPQEETGFFSRKFGSGDKG